MSSASSSTTPKLGLWLLVAFLSTAFLQFGLDSGAAETAIWITLLVLLGQFWTSTCQWRDIPLPAIAVAALVLILLFISWTAAFELTDTHRSIRLVKFLILAVGAWCVAKQTSPNVLKPALAGLVSAIVVWQAGQLYLMKRPYGVFDNPHYLSYYSVLLTPLLLILSRRMQSAWRYVLLAILALNVSFVLSDVNPKKTIPLLSLLCAFFIWLALIAKGWMRWAVAVSIIAGSVVAVLSSSIMRFIQTEERIQIWSDSLRMINEAPLEPWIFGHGIGSFSENFSAFSDPAYQMFSFPHNPILQALYENGAAGCSIIVLSLSALFAHSILLYHRSANLALRQINLTNLVTLSIWLVFSSLAFGLYSSYTLYPLGIMLGVYLFICNHATPQLNLSRNRST